MDRALRPIANVRGGDGVAALATGRVAPDNRRQESPTAAADSRGCRIAAVLFPEATIRGGGWQPGDRSASPRLDESGFHIIDCDS